MQTVRPPTGADAGDDAVGRRIGLLVAREEEVLLELGSRVEEELQAVADEELALVLQLVPVLDVALLDAGALAEVALLSHGRPPPDHFAGGAAIGIGPEDDDEHADAVAWTADDRRARQARRRCSRS